MTGCECNSASSAGATRSGNAFCEGCKDVSIRRQGTVTRATPRVQRWHVGLLALALAAFWPAQLHVHSAGPAEGEPEMHLPDPDEMARVEAAVDRALEYLVQHQKEDGSWPSGVGNNNGVNAVCLLAFLGRGHVPGRGPYRVVVDRSLRQLLGSQNEDGLYESEDASHGPMYEHGLATLAMIEAYGYYPEPALHRSIQKAVDLIVRTQNDAGGWRYHPRPRDADLSVTVMQIVALHAAMNARFEVPDEAMGAALDYVRACVHDSGGFRYMPDRGGAASPRSAAGALSLLLLASTQEDIDFDDPGIHEALAYVEDSNYRPGQSHFWYLNYYSMQAFYQAGGDWWEKWHPRVRDFLLENQHPEGSWEGYSENRYAGDTDCYSTAFGAITLQVYLHYLPAYQR